MKEDAMHLTPGCESSFRLSDGSVYSQRGRMTSPQWTAECQRVAEYLKIPIEQHQARYGVEYLAKDVPKPHHGLLAERMIYWLMIDFHPEASRAIGTLLASVYLQQADETIIPQPVVMYLRGFDAHYVAWVEVAKVIVAEDDPARYETWVSKAKGLLADWWSEIARDLHQLE